MHKLEGQRSQRVQVKNSTSFDILLIQVRNYEILVFLKYRGTVYVYMFDLSHTGILKWIMSQEAECGNCSAD